MFEFGGALALASYIHAQCYMFSSVKRQACIEIQNANATYVKQKHLYFIRQLYVLLGSDTKTGVTYIAAFSLVAEKNDSSCLCMILGTTLTAFIVTCVRVVTCER